MRNEYRKTGGKSLMLTTLLCPDPNYELAMLQNNELRGLLPFDLIAENGEWKMVYDITSQQSLDSWMETERMDTAVFTGLLSSVGELYGRLAPYLIRVKKVSLQPDHVFIRNGTSEFSFCFLPEEEVFAGDPLRDLLEYLIARIDHHDDRLVQVVYQAYEKTADSAYRIADLVEPVSDPKVLQPNSTPSLLQPLGSPNLLQSEDRYDFRSDQEEEEEEAPWEEKKSGERKSLLSSLFSRPKRSEKRVKQAWYEIDEEEMEQEGSDRQEQELYEETTTFLNPEEECCKGILRYTGAGEEKDLVISEVPFLIGTKTGIGGALHSPAVSRLHAKITMAGEVYLLQDLNSTNGTYVNETILNYKSPVGLHKKDRIRFADEEFLFL